MLNSSQKLTGNIYKWLDQKYPQGSKSLKEMKDAINASTAHANLVYAGAILRWLTTQFRRRSSISRTTMRSGAIYGMNRSVGSIKFVDDFHQRFDALVEQSNALNAEMKSTERYKAAMKAAAGVAESRKLVFREIQIRMHCLS